MNLDRIFHPAKAQKPQRDIFADLLQEMNRYFDRYNLAGPAFEPLDLTGDNGSSMLAQIDVTEQENGIEIVADVPGVKEKDITVQLDGKSLSIRGERSSEKADEKKDYKLIERSSGSFVRSLVLPFEPESEAVIADLKDGVLTINIPKPENARERVKTISISDNKTELEN